jgi:hypothetical protein
LFARIVGERKVREQAAQTKAPITVAEPVRPTRLSGPEAWDYLRQQLADLDESVCARRTRY